MYWCLPTKQQTFMTCHQIIITLYFQKTLMSGLKKIQSSKYVLVFTDKTANLYEMSPDQCNSLLKNNINKTCRKTELITKTKIEKETRKLSKSLKLDNKMECYKIKYHKGNFKQNTKCRLSKKRYRTSQQNVYCTDYRDVNNITKFNQWRNTSTVIKWFQNITNENNYRFIKFDISEFYPSISEEVLEKSINFANGITN